LIFFGREGVERGRGGDGWRDREGKVRVKYSPGDEAKRSEVERSGDEAKQSKARVKHKVKVKCSNS
jgi:hypothetical protein